MSDFDWNDFQRRKQEMLKKYYGGDDVTSKAEDANMIDEVKKGLEGVENAVKELHPKEKSTLDKQLDDFITGGQDARIAQAKERYINLKPQERIAFQEKHPELFNAMFPKDEIPKPANYDNFIAQVKADPTAVNKIPYNVRNYAFMLDPDAKRVIETAQTFTAYKGVSDTSNPLLNGKYKGQ